MTKYLEVVVDDHDKGMTGVDVGECIEGRTSIRVFKPDPVEDEVVNEALRMANLAPSAGNLQARDFIVVKGASTKKALAEAAYGQDFVRTAPVVVVFCADLERIRTLRRQGQDPVLPPGRGRGGAEHDAVPV